MIKKPLTKKQQEIYSYIKEYLKDYIKSPTLEEIKSHTGVGAVNTIVQHLKALEKKGYINRKKYSRDIEIKEDREDMTMSIPVLAYAGCDDLSVFAEQNNVDEYIEIDKKIIGNKKEVVAVRATGDSMNNSGILDGDYVLIELTSDVLSGEKVVAIVNDMITIKKLEKRGDYIILKPDSTNTKYKPIILDSDFKIAGKVICSIPGQSMDITEEIVPIEYNRQQIN